MLVCEVTPKRMGITIWGDYDSLERLHQLIHFIHDTSAIIDDKEAFLGHLAYDLRKAMECDRKKRSVLLGNGIESTQYGVSILIPIVLVQMAVIRLAMAFIPTTKMQQAIIYEFEGAVEDALNEANPTYSQQILENIRSLGDTSYKYLTDKMMSRCYYLLKTPVKNRLKILPQLMYSFDPTYNVFPLQTLAPNEFVEENIQLPEFDW